MRRAILAMLLAAGVTGGLTRAQAVKPAAPTESREMVPDPRYTPRQGDRANLIADPTPAFSRAALFDDYANFTRADDQKALQAMIDQGDLVELEAKVPVQVLRNLAPSDAREPGRRYPVEVRVLGGPRAGESWFVPESSVVRLVPKLVHPPMAVGSMSTIAKPGTILYADWDALEAVTRSPGSVTEPKENLPLDTGVKVVILERRGEAVRVRVQSGSTLKGRVGVVDRASLRPIESPPRPVLQKPTAGR